MKLYPVQTPPASPPSSANLPQWEQLSPARQRELVMTLATLLVKQLPAPMRPQQESQDESPGQDSKPTS